MKAFTLIIVSCCSAGLLFGDFSYQQQAKITGGAMMGAIRVAGVFSKQLREPMVTAHYYKGNRMVAVSPQSTEIIDLDKETITTINIQRKTYSVMTFEQMKQAMEDMARKMHDKQGESPDITFDASVEETGQRKTIGAYDTHEAIVKVIMHMKDAKTGQTSDMTIRSDMWLAPDIAGYDEVRAFQKKLAEKLGISLAGGMGGMMRPEMLKGMSQAAAEASKLKGVPVYDIVSIEGAPSPSGPPPQSASSGSNDSQPTSMTQALGRLGGFGRHKKSDDADQQQQAKPASGGNPNALIEMTTESSNFAPDAVDDAKFEIPAGYKQVEPKR